jgi:hypothetical protein
LGDDGFDHCDDWRYAADEPDPEIPDDPDDWRSEAEEEDD